MNFRASSEIASLFGQASRLHADARLDDAVAILEVLREKHAAYAPALNLLGIIKGQQGDLDRGCAFVNEAIDLQPGNAIFLRNLCELHRMAGRAGRGVEAGRQAVACDPLDHVAKFNLAMAEADSLGFEAALRLTDELIAVEPNHASAYFLRGQVNLLLGHFADGWRDYAWRWRIPGAALQPPQALPVWNGERLKGRLLLLADQGFGDVIMFARYIPWAMAFCDGLLLRCPLELRGLLQRLAPDAEIVSELQASDALAFCTLSGLPGLAGTTIASIPKPAGYLRPCPRAGERWSQRLDQLTPPASRRIGLVWAGNPSHPGDRQRSTTLAACQSLLDLPDTVFVALQKGPAAAEVGRSFGPAPLVNLGPELMDFEDTAACIAQLDAIVTVDTAVAHLAGALGKTVHILLPQRPDWRWLLGRADSPWYSAAHLHRDCFPGDRARTIALLSAELALTGFHNLGVRS